VAEHHHESRAISRGREFHAADLGWSDDVAGDADDEEVPQTLIEYDLRWNARIGTSENYRERLLPGRQLDASSVTHERVGSTHVRREPEIAFSQTC
jgi:hypothetical protein